MPIKYKILHWNANGLLQNSNELKLFLESNKIDLALISETHLTNKSIVRIPNYKIYRTDQPDNRSHGGTAVLVHSGVKHHESDKHQFVNMQATSVVVEDSSGHFTISSIYCSPKHKITTTEFQDFFKTLGHRFIAAGDFNAKHPHWGSRLTTTKGRELYRSILNLNLDIISAGEPTHWPSDLNKIPDCIDFGVMKGINKNKITSQTSLDLPSDHSPVIIELDSIINKETSPPHLTNKRTDWTSFKDHFTEHINFMLPLRSDEDIINAVEHLNHCIQQAAWYSTPNNASHQTKAHTSWEVRETISEENMANHQRPSNQNPIK